MTKENDPHDLKLKIQITSVNNASNETLNLLSKQIAHLGPCSQCSA